MVASAFSGPLQSQSKCPFSRGELREIIHSGRIAIGAWQWAFCEGRPASNEPVHVWRLGLGVTSVCSIQSFKSSIAMKRTLSAF